jgi:peptidoglycan/LPS O-acetylase OafA/YrhL/lysophospholipase L1-like esterase
MVRMATATEGTAESAESEAIAASHHRAPRLGYIPALDGLRAVAVLAVLLYHADVPWWKGGFLGVDVFFVISGYLITCLLLADWTNHHHLGLGRFWYRRARRLLPALFVMLAVVSLYAALFLPDVLAQLRGEVLAAVFYVENWFLLFRNLSYFQASGRPPLLQHVWSLAVEEQFYLLWPIILLVALKVWGGMKKRIVLGVLAGVLVSTVLMAVLYHPFHDPSRVYYGTDTRAAALLLGAVLAFVWAPWRLQGRTGRNAGVVLDVAAAVSALVLLWMFHSVSYLDSGLYRGGFLVAAIVSGVLIAATVHPKAKVSAAVLGIAVFRWIGVRAYGIYLWHWPIFMVTRPHSDIGLTGLPLLILRLALTFGIAALSYHFLEEPIRHGALERWWARYKGLTGERRTVANKWMGVGAAAGVLALLFVTVQMVSAEASGPPGGFPKESSVLITPSTTTPVTAPGESTTTTVPPASGLRAGYATAVGDSVMLGSKDAMVKILNQVVGGGSDVTVVDAAESRQYTAGVDEVQTLKDQGLLGDRVVVHLGTNGEIDPGQFERLMGILAGAKRVVIVNVKAPRPWEAPDNDTLANEVKKYKNAVLVDWNKIGNENPGWFYNDGIHLNPAGRLAYAELVAGALTKGQV